MIENKSIESETAAAVAGAAHGSTPVEQRISHRIMIYAAHRAPSMMNQFTIEDIVKEEMAKESNEKLSA